MKKERTLKQQAFLAEYLQNGYNATEAYLHISPRTKRTSAGTLGRKMLREIELSEDEVLKIRGLTFEGLLDIIKDGTQAQKYNAKGIAVAPDYDARFKFVELALKLLGRYPDTKVGLDFTGDLTIVERLPDGYKP